MTKDALLASRHVVDASRDVVLAATDDVVASVDLVPGPGNASPAASNEPSGRKAVVLRHEDDRPGPAHCFPALRRKLPLRTRRAWIVVAFVFGSVGFAVCVIGA